MKRSLAVTVLALVTTSATPVLAGTAPTAPGDPVLVRSSRGEAVLELEERLLAAGFPVGPVDGFLDGATQLALRAFQADADIPITGVVTQATWDALREATTPPASLDVPAESLTLGPLREYPGWQQAAPLVTDGRVLPAAFAAAGYEPPAGSKVLVVRVVDGPREPAYQLYQAGGGAFTDRFWPASSVKLIAAVGALESVGRFGFSATSRVRFDDGYSSTIGSVLWLSLVYSSNAHFDRSVMLAGFDWLNTDFADGHGLEATSFGEAYSDALDVSASPGFRLTSATGTERYRPAVDSAEWYGNTDTTLFELFDVQRRVLLAERLPAADRFKLSPEDRALLEDALCRSTTKWVGPAAVRVFGGGTSVCNKAGWLPHAQCVDHGRIVTPAGDTYFIAVTVRYDSGCRELARLAEASLEAVSARGDATPLHADFGVGVDVTVERVAADRVQIGVEVPGADRVELFLDGRRLAVSDRDGAVTTDLPQPGAHAVVVRGWSVDRLITHHTLTFEVSVDQ